MVCLRQSPKQQQSKEPHARSTTKSSNSRRQETHAASTMNFSGAKDRLQLQYLAGCDIVSQPPLFSPNGDFIFLINDKVIKVYSTGTGELTRELTGAEEKIISMELELNQKESLVTCTSAGEVLHWHWRTGELHKRQTLDLRKSEVMTFNLLNLYKESDTACAAVTLRCGRKHIQWFVFNTSTGKRLQWPCNLRLPEAETPLVAAGTNNFKILVLVQGFTVYFINYETWQWQSLRNAHRVPITVVRVHPTEDLVATGDETGKVFLWRQYMNSKTVATSLYHWHHTAVTSIAFSAAGSSFYSSGLESVLVKWNIERTDVRDFLPRTSSIIRHIVVSEDNTKVAISLADNGVQFVGNDNQLKSTLQEFTYIVDDKTGKSKFPVGLRINPRSNTLVLNGRIGHLQFYSANTKKFLYNLDVVLQNQLSMETGKILYNIYVSKAAFNIDWMATGEVYNDEEHLPELRLKFWKFQEESQSYVLNTNIELPHEGGFRAIEFSNAYKVDNLLCATVGEDNIIRMWSLEDSDSIYRQGKVWYCIAEAGYKGMPIEAVSFSQDGSLLAAGFGNTLCIYKANTLKLKAALTGSAGHDGFVQKAQVSVPRSSPGANGSRSELIERRKRLLQLFTNLLEHNDETLIKEIQKMALLQAKQRTSVKSAQPLENIDDEKLKLQLYNKILEMPELNLYQKVLLYQRLGIRCKVPQQWQERMIAYLNNTLAPASLKEKSAKLNAQVHRLNMRERFKAKYRLQQYDTHKRYYDEEVAQHLVPILSVLSLSEQSKPKANPNLHSKNNGIDKSASDEEMRSAELAEGTRKLAPPPLQWPAQITHVQFASGEYAHLVVICTETRVLIWNLLNLRLHAVLKLSVQHLAFDEQTNLIAVFTKHNELHVFQPNVPLPIYQRNDVPQLYGAIWVPRPHPKQRSINVDWQSQSTLYFLTQKQEIIFLGSPKEFAADTPTPITFNAAATDSLRYTTFGTYATKQHTDKPVNSKMQLGPLILGHTARSTVKSFIEMSTHTMPPLNLLCGDFVKSLVKPAETVTAAAAEQQKSTPDARDGGKANNGPLLRAVEARMNNHAPASDSEADDNDDDVVEDDKTKVRKHLLHKEEQLSKAQQVDAATQSTLSAEAQLQKVAAQYVDLEF